MALSRVVSEIFNVEKYRDVEIPVKGQSRSVESGTIRSTGYGFVPVFYSNFVPSHSVFEIFDFKNAVTSKTVLRVRQVHWKCRHSIQRM